MTRAGSARTGEPHCRDHTAGRTARRHCVWFNTPHYVQADVVNLKLEAHCYVVVAHRLQWLNVHANFVLLSPDNARPSPFLC